MKLTRSAVGAIAALAIVLTGCSGQPAPTSTSSPTSEVPQEQITVGFLVKSLTVDFWLNLVKGAKDMAAEQGGIEIVEFAPSSEAAVEEQVNQVDNLVARGVDAIVIAPVAPVQLKPAVERAVDAGIPVVVIDTRIEGFEDKQAAYVGNDNRAGGVTAGKFIVEQLANQGKLGLVNGTPGVSAVEDRIAGVKEAVAGSGVEVAQEVAAVDCTRDRGVSAGEDLLTAHPDLAAIFVACPEAAVGVQQAIRSSGKSFDDIALVGFGAGEDELKSIKAGEQRATLAQAPEVLGKSALTAALQAVRGEDIPNKDIDAGFEMVTIDNVDQFLDS